MTDDKLTVADVKDEYDELLILRGARNDKHAHLNGDCPNAQFGDNPAWIDSVGLFDDMPICTRCADERTVHDGETNDPNKHTRAMEKEAHADL